MQPPTIAPRSGYTADEITALIRDTPAPVIGAGLELIDRNLDVLEDLTDDLLGGHVERDSYANLHGKCTIDLMRALDWGQAIIRPYATIDDVRFDLGAYFTDVNSWSHGTDTPTFTVQGHDILTALNDRVGGGHQVAAGANVLAGVEEILQQQGYTQYIIDPLRSDAVWPSARPWLMDDNTTWLSIVNDMLAAVGYQGIWSDWRGALQCVAYANPVDRSAEWVYYGDGDASQLPLERTGTRDLFDAPNRWIAVRQNNIEGDAPVEGDGIYTFINESLGPTSVEARGGRVVTAPFITVDAADQAALVTAVQRRAAADMSIPTTYELALPSPGNPLHWHFDRCYVVDSEIGLAEVLVTKWNLPLAPSLDSQAMSWSVLDA